MPRKKNHLRFVDEQLEDEEVAEVRHYVEQLLNDICSEPQSHNSQSNNSTSIDVGHENEPGSSKTRNFRGPTILKDIWNMPPGKTIDVQFNDRNQAIGKMGRKLSSFLGIVARTPELAPLNIDDWRLFDKDKKEKLLEFVRKKFSIPTRGEEYVKKSLAKKWKDYKCNLRSTHMGKFKTKDALLKNRPNHIPRDQWLGLVSYWFSDKAKKRSQANANNRKRLKMPHTGGSKSIATLMNEKAKDGVEPTRAEVFILTHTKRKDGRPLDKESAKVVEMIQERLNNDEPLDEQHDNTVAWERDLYSQVLGSDRSGYVRGLGLGPTPCTLWGSKSFIRYTDNMSNEVVQRLQQEVKELKELKEKQDEEISLMKESQDKLLSDLSLMRQVMLKYFPVELSMPQNISGSSSGQAPDANSDHPQAPTLPALPSLIRTRASTQNLRGSPSGQILDVNSGHKQAPTVPDLPSLIRPRTRTRTRTRTRSSHSKK